MQQWNFGIQHELKNFVVEARYVGNHGTKLLRAIDLNQININAGGFLGDFLKAQSNGNLALSKTGVFNPAFDPTIAGSQQLTVFPTMPSGGNLTNSTNRTYLQQGAVADMAYNYQSTKANGPVNFFQNPYATSLRLMTNFSNSDYNGAQFEIRSRDWRGLTLQANYTYSKALSDADSGSDNNNQGRFEPLMDNNNPKLEKARALFDLTHVERFNYVYRIPVGTAHRFGYKPLNHYVLDGWQMSGIFNRQSGEPYSICSGIGTFNRNNILATNTCNTADTTLNMGQLRQDLQFRMSGSGPFMSSASITNTSGQAAVAGGTPFSGQIFYTAPAGTIGDLQKRQFDGPWDTTFDFGASKTTHITEKQTLLLRMDATNFLNHPSFALAGDQTVTSATFGKITSTFAARPANSVHATVSLLRSVNDLDNRGGRHAEADTHRLQAVAAAIFFEDVDQLGHQNCASGPEGMAVRDCPAFDVQAAGWRLNFAGPDDRHHGKRLVDLESVDVGGSQTSHFQSFLCCSDGPSEHQLWIAADHGSRDDAGSFLKTELFRCLSVSQ